MTDQLLVGQEGKAWADCGKANTMRLYPSSAIYNVLVRGDSTSSTVKAIVRWSLGSEKAVVRECSTNHVWERGFEADVKSLAESTPVTSTADAPARQPAEAAAPQAPLEARQGLAGMPGGTRFISSLSQQMYYPVGCAATKTLPEADRLYYAAEDAPKRAGFRRSIVC